MQKIIKSAKKVIYTPNIEWLQGLSAVLGDPFVFCNKNEIFKDFFKWNQSE